MLTQPTVPTKRMAGRYSKATIRFPDMVTAANAVTAGGQRDGGQQRTLDVGQVIDRDYQYVKQIAAQQNPAVRMWP